jgi:toxin ParE1/3/4
MAHRLALEAEADLDDIWYFIATESGSSEVADRFIESLSQPFLLLARHPHLGRRRDEDLLPGLRSFSSADTSSCTVSSRMATC